MSFLRFLLLPFTIIYWAIVFLRNRLYDYNIFISKEFSLPIISVGNLTTGGTGKTPHVEYLVRLLKEKHKIATLSRGYGRDTNKFLLVEINSTHNEVGDEPLQIKKKFKDIIVAVDRKRVEGIQKLKNLFSDIEIILLDDAFQHRSVKAGLSILLIDYNKTNWSNYLLPLGSLREPFSAIKRADIIVVTKTPKDISPIEQRVLKEEISLKAYQSIFFSYISYGSIVPMFNESPINVSSDYYFENDYSVLLFTGIANPKPLEDFLSSKISKLLTIKFSDHHKYNKNDILKISDYYNKINDNHKIILTTEKDARRLDGNPLIEDLKQFPVFYIPIQIVFHDNNEEQFNKQILEYVRKNRIFN